MEIESNCPNCSHLNTSRYETMRAFMFPLEFVPREIWLSVLAANGIIKLKLS